MDKTKTLKADRIKSTSITKLILLGSVLGGILLITLFGLAALFGVEILKWNDQYVTGIKGLIASPFIGAFAGFIFGVASSVLTSVGLGVYSKFRGIKINYVSSGSSEHQ
ncbi:MAG: hypothetical protein ACQEQC_07775 [Elusimicrobiota bacterium]